MKVTLEKKEKNQVHLEVEVDNEQVKKALERAYRQVSQRVNIPGFRKGKAPRQLVEKTVGLDYIKNEALDKLVPEALEQAVTEQQLEVIERPDVEVVSFETDQPLVFKATVPVRPEVEFQGNPLELSAQAPKTELDPAAVEERLTQMREQKADYQVVERAIAEGDRAKIDFLGKYKESGEPFEGGSAEGFTAEIAPGRFIEGFAEALYGLKAGEEKDFDVTFPESYHNAELAGKPATFHVKVHEVLGRTVPALDDAFAASQGDFNTVADLRAHVEKELTEEAEESREMLLRQQILDQLLEKAQVEIPESMIGRETNFLIQQYAQMMQAQGQNVQSLFTPDRIGEWRESLKEEAVKRIKTSLTLGTVARQEGIVITSEEVDEEILSYAQMYRVDPAAVRQQLIETGAWNTLADEVLSNKILDHLREKATVTEGPIPEAYAPKAEGEEAAAAEAKPAKKTTTRKKKAAEPEAEGAAEEAPAEAE